DTILGSTWQTIPINIRNLKHDQFYYYRFNAESKWGECVADINQFYTTDCEIINCDLEEWDSIWLARPQFCSGFGYTNKVAHNGGYAAEIKGGARFWEGIL